MLTQTALTPGQLLVGRLYATVRVNPCPALFDVHHPVLILLV